MSQPHLPVATVIRPKNFPKQVIIVPDQEKEKVEWVFRLYPELATILFMGCLLGILLSALTEDIMHVAGFTVVLLLLLRRAP